MLFINDMSYVLHCQLTTVDYRSDLNSRDGRFGSKVGQIGPKWDKSGAFSDQISVHLAPTIPDGWAPAGV